MYYAGSTLSSAYTTYPVGFVMHSDPTLSCLTLTYTPFTDNSNLVSYSLTTNNTALTFTTAVSTYDLTVFSPTYSDVAFSSIP